MNLAMNIGFLIITIFFMGVYVTSFVLNLLRSMKVVKAIKNNPQKVKGRIAAVEKMKKNYIVKIKFTSPANHLEFIENFEIFAGDFKEEDYQKDQEVYLLYSDLESTKKTHCFPVYLEGRPVKIEKGPLVMDIFVAIAGIYFFAQSLYNMIITDAFSGDVPLYGSDNASHTSIMVFLTLIIYAVLIGFVIERVFSMSADHNQKYLKICGYPGSARVITYKFGRNKDSKGNKESQLKIEFFTNKGDKIEANLHSFMYTETQEEYIDVLYDGKNPKNVVYMRK